MNINLNLATRPYIELRPVYARLRVLGVVLAVLAFPLLLLVHVEETGARRAQARVNALAANIARLRQQQESARALAIEGPNANVLTQAAFLNDAFRRKAFSWTATMSDLEQTLPYGVQVALIDPLVAPDGHVTIRIRVTGARERAVEVIRGLEHSRHFVAPRLVVEALSNRGQNGQARNVAATSTSPSDVSFDIIADYRPLPDSHDRAGVQARSVQIRKAEAAETRHAAGRQAQLTRPAGAVAGAGAPPHRRRAAHKPSAGLPQIPLGGPR